MTRISFEQMPPVKNEEQKRHLIRYVNFINSRPERDLIKDGSYFNVHHIIPRSLRGTENESNLIKLTHREHYIVHMILHYCYGEKLSYAFYYMSNKMNLKNSKQYENLKKYIKENEIQINNGRENTTVYSVDDIPSGWKVGRYTSSKQKENLSKIISNFIWITNGTVNKRINRESKVPNGFYFGKTESELKKNRDNSTGKTWYNNGVKNIYLECGAEIPNGFTRGFVCKREKRYDLGMRRFWINNGIENKFILEEDLIFYKDWIPGRVNVNYKKKNKKTWVNDGINQKKVDIDKIPDGWKIGMCRKKKSTKKIPKKYWVNNGKENILIPTTQTLSADYKLGKIKKEKIRKAYHANNGFIEIKLPINVPLPEGFVKGGLPRCRRQ